MSLKTQRILNVSMIILSWFGLFFIGRNNIKRFFLATLIVGILEIINARIGKKQKWWVFYNKTNSYSFGELPFNIGPFIFLSLWSLKVAYGDFKKFMSISAILHAFFAFPYTFLAKKLKYYTLVRFNHIQFFFYFFSKAFLLYWVQYFLENRHRLTKL